MLLFFLFQDCLQTKIIRQLFGTIAVAFSNRRAVIVKPVLVSSLFFAKKKGSEFNLGLPF